MLKRELIGCINIPETFMYHLTNITSLILETYYGERLGLGLGLDIKLSP